MPEDNWHSTFVDNESNLALVGGAVGGAAAVIVIIVVCIVLIVIIIIKIKNKGKSASGKATFHVQVADVRFFFSDDEFW